MGKEKKAFKDTKFGQFLNKAGGSIPEILTIAGKVATGNIGGAIQYIIGETSNILEDKAKNDANAKALLIEFEKYKMTYEKELFELEVEDRKSARTREVELAKTGKTDWLMYAAGTTALGTFLLMVYAVIFMPSTVDNTLFHQLMGIIEGVALSVFGYYFGTSKSQNEQ